MIDYLKAKYFVLSVGVTWGLLMLLTLFPMIAAYIFDRFDKRQVPLKILYSIVLVQDLFVNALHFNYFKTTVSSELGNLKANKSKSGTLMANFVDWLFYIADGQIDHCLNAREPEDKFYFKASRALLGMVTFYGNLTALYFLIR